MNEVTLVKNHYRMEQWRKLIIECKNSGLNVQDWCAQNDITKHAYYYWLRKLREEACEDLPAIPKKAKAVSFKKIEVETPVPNTATAVIIHLPSTTIEVREGTSRQTIEAVLLALKNIC